MVRNAFQPSKQFLDLKVIRMLRTGSSRRSSVKLESGGVSSLFSGKRSSGQLF